MSEHLTIRNLAKEDVGAYRELRLRALRDHPEAFGTAVDEFAARPIADVAARLEATPYSFTLGAFVTKRYVGTLTFVQEERPKLQHRGHIYGVYVAPEARGQGVARALLSETIRRARTFPYLEEIDLAVTTTNTAAKKLYESVGFVTAWHEPRFLKLNGRYYNSDWMLLELDKS